MATRNPKCGGYRVRMHSPFSIELDLELEPERKSQCLPDHVIITRTNTKRWNRGRRQRGKNQKSSSAKSVYPFLGDIECDGKYDGMRCGVMWRERESVNVECFEMNEYYDSMD